ncbi:UNVERIFIED_CONTAM: hypothetical protein GTU68_044473, partial [Idotea baltica]|nr:hypothetical protein [Idotea baltica]
PGSSAIGHVRYTTAGQHRLANVQPFFAEISVGKVGLAHNGNLINADELREELIEDGAIFGTSSDTEAILHLLARTKKNLPRSERVISALQRIKGAYSLLMEFDDRMYAIRDPNGFRPLSLGKLNDGYVFASETCAFDLIGAEFVRDVEPGEVLEIDINNELKSYYPFGVQKESPCIFEYVYFSRPDSNIYGKNVYSLRINMGKELARESLVEADIVMAVPDSGVPAAIGYAQESGIPFEYGLIRNHYVGRTFIEPTQSIRDFGVKIKLNPNPSLLKGKRVVVVDDSIVRGTTSKKLVKMIQQAGAKEVHVRISSPPTTDPCYYGIDTPQKEKLIAANSDTETIRKYLGADTLSYISLDGLYRAVDSAKGSFCDACFTGNYPIGIGKSKRIEQVGLFESEE